MQHPFIQRRVHIIDLFIPCLSSFVTRRRRLLPAQDSKLPTSGQLSYSSLKNEMIDEHDNEPQQAAFSNNILAFTLTPFLRL